MLLAWLSFYGLFDYALHVPFPRGLLLDWLTIRELFISVTELWGAMGRTTLCLDTFNVFFPWDSVVRR
jgi:hypothetical protein